MKKFMSMGIMAVIITAFIVILIAMNNFHQTIEKKYVSDIYSRLAELSVNNAANIHSKISDQFEMMHALSAYLAEEDLRGEAALATINKTVDAYGFLRCAITFLDGTFITHDNKNIGNSAKDEHVVKGLQGVSSVTGPRSAVVDPTKSVILLTVPIYQGQKIIALLTCTYETKYLSNVFQMTSFGGKGYSYIVDANGSIISRPEMDSLIYDGDNILTFFQEQAQNAYPEIKKDILEMKNGTISANINGQQKYINYQPLGINQWYVFSVTSGEVLEGQLNSILESVYTLSSIIIVTLLILILLIGLYIYLLQKKAKEELQKLAYYDTLTGLPNRNSFKKEARRILDTASGEYAYIILNINKFKLINDVFGFAKGDRVLLHIADILRLEAGKDEVCARFDADHFHILSIYSSQAELEKRMLRVADKISTCTLEKDASSKISVGFGAYYIEDKLKSVSLMGDKARMALAKIKGIHSTVTYFYNNEIIKQLMEEQELEDAMQSALERGEMKLYLQPKYEIETTQMRGAEALVRWQHPRRGLIMPDSFIPLFEKNGFIIKLDMYMVEISCKKLREWQDKAWAVTPISVNQSRSCLYQPGYTQELIQILKRYDISPALIELEITERAFFEDELALIKVIETLHEIGFKVAMDDFGAGYSSLNMLQDVLVDVLKIDKNFFRESINSERGKKIVSNIVSMANDLDMEVVAEGIETKEQLNFLKEIHCQSVQGYYFSKPIPIEAFEQMHCDKVPHG